MSFHGCFDKFRKRWQNPEVILNRIGLKSGFTFLDVGCGDGFFALPAAHIVGGNGKVYGLDKDDNAIDRLIKRAEKKGLDNIVLKVGKAEEYIM